jgi:hypothetical protein
MDAQAGRAEGRVDFSFVAVDDGVEDRDVRRGGLRGGVRSFELPTASAQSTRSRAVVTSEDH